MLAPWSVWPPLWRGASKASLQEPGVWFCLSGLVVAFVGFSIISGKQAQYLLPESALFAVLFARWRGFPERTGATLGRGASSRVHRDRRAGGCVRVQAPARAAGSDAGGALHGCRCSVRSVGRLWAWPTLPVRDLLGQAARICAASVVALAGMLVAVTLAFRPAWELAPAGARLHELQLQHVPLAHEDVYHGQFHFAGRLFAPIQSMTEEQIADWLQQHPQGRAVVYYEHEPYAGPGRMEYSQAYRSRRLAIVTSSTSTVPQPSPRPLSRRP